MTSTPLPLTSDRRQAAITDLMLNLKELAQSPELMTVIRGQMARRHNLTLSQTDQLVRDLERDGVVIWRRGVVWLLSTETAS